MKAILIIAHHCILPGAYKGFEEIIIRRSMKALEGLFSDEIFFLILIFKMILKLQFIKFFLIPKTCLGFIGL